MGSAQATGRATWRVKIRSAGVPGGLTGSLADNRPLNLDMTRPE